MGWRVMSEAFHRHHAAESRHRCRTLAQFHAHRNGSVKRLQAIQNLLTEVLDREAADRPRQLLQISDRQAVVGAEGEIIIGSGLTEIQPEAQIQSEPSIAPFMVQDPDVSPKP